jgi:hypothetical protein
MNVKEWEKSLRSAGLLEKYQDVLEGFSHGFDQGIPQHTLNGMRWYTPDNHKSAAETREKIEDNIAKELQAGRMFGPFKHEEVAKFFPFFRTSLMGAAVNADGSIRPINDLSFPRNDINLP